MKPIDQEQSVHSMSEVGDAIRSGADAMTTLSLVQPWLVKRSKMLYFQQQDLFPGMTWEDIHGEVQERLLERLTNIGIEPDRSVSETESRLNAFIFYSLRETKTAALRRKKRVSTADIESIADNALVEPNEIECDESYEKVMLRVFLLTCIGELQSKRQQELASQLLRGSTQAQVSEQFKMSKQSTSNLFQRMRQNLQSCIESKRQAFEWTPNSQSS